MYTTTILSTLALLLLSTNPTNASCAHGTTLHRRASNSTKPTLPNFDYRTTRGPTNWQSISPENSLCATGKTQSPIILDSSIAIAGPGFVKMHIDTTDDILFENLGTNVEVVVNGTTTIGNTTFALKQFHFHTPSEHRINDEHFAIEVHFVHEEESNPTNMAVVGLLIQLADWESISTSPLSDVISHVDAIPTPGDTTEIPSLDFSPLLRAIENAHFYQYQGSLTTPPCSEGVNFLVAVHPMPLHVSMYNRLKKVVKANARFVQNTLGGENLLAVAAQFFEQTK